MPAQEWMNVYMKNAEFCGKTSKLLPKRCLLIFGIFYLNEKELNQQACVIKYVEMNFLTLRFTN